MCELLNLDVRYAEKFYCKKIIFNIVLLLVYTYVELLVPSWCFQ